MKYIAPRILRQMVIVVCAAVSLAMSSESGKQDAATALKMLHDGNQRYVTNAVRSKNYPGERQEQLHGQNPYAIVITCADSRVSPEIIFDESLGKLFVIRVAGNVMDQVVLGSIEYAAEHLHTKLLMVLGHTSCGAVTAAVQGGNLPPNIKAITDKIQPSVDKVKKKETNKEAMVSEVISENVMEQMNAAKKSSTIISELTEHRELQIVGGVYDISTGIVSFFR